MKHFFREWIIKLFALVGVVYLYRILFKNKRALVRVISFHDVPEDQWFDSLIEHLDSKYNIISPADFRNKTFEVDKINILLTFDDGYDSWVKVVLPTLKKLSIKGLFFINSGLLDVSEDYRATESFMNDRLLVSTKRPLTWEGARTLVEAGHTIGGHSKNHHRLSALDISSLESEIIEDKNRIEEMLGIDIEHFAYPFGNDVDFEGSAKEVVVSAGYTHVYTAKTGWYNEDELKVPRTLLEKNQDVSSVVRWIEGGYDIFSRINQLVKLK